MHEGSGSVQGCTSHSLYFGLFDLSISAVTCALDSKGVAWLSVSKHVPRDLPRKFSIQWTVDLGTGGSSQAVKEQKNNIPLHVQRGHCMAFISFASS